VKDLYGNCDTQHWNPRGCGKGFTHQRRLYGPYQRSYLLMRKGWKERADDGFPSLSDKPELCDIPEMILHGESFIVHREGPEATPYLPNVIVSSNPLIRPDDCGIPLDAMHWDERTIRTVKLPWQEVLKTKNPLWEAGYRFFLLMPKTRHRVHSSWSTVDWQIIWDSNHGDPFRTDKRIPDFDDHQMHMNPDDAKEMAIKNGDYIYVDSNPEDRPFRSWQQDPKRAKVARLRLRVSYNPSYPRGVVMTKHAPFIAAEKSVLAHETNPDGWAWSADTGYQANLRYGVHNPAPATG
jgi:nitrate reductase alpha subunit